MTAAGPDTKPVNKRGATRDRMVRSAAAETRSLTQRFSEATQKRRSWRLGWKRRRVLRLECETLLPVVVRLPVTWQTLDTVHLDGVWLFPVARETAAPP